jgi:Sucrase/ferredoxin-like
MGEKLPLRCATESLARNEPLIGTASRVQRWLVVEQPGAWGRDALTESLLPAEVAAPLAAHARSHRVRVLLARRPGDVRRDGDRRVLLAHTGAERRWIEQLVVPAAHPERLLDLELGPLAFPDPPGLGEPGPLGLALVCTNGRHDPCCADMGRPVVRALQAAGVPDVWEASHVGGDRFAANIVSLPDGVYYGRVEPDEAAALLAAHRAGTIDLERYRGRSYLPPLVQAADLYARRHLGETRIDGLTVLSTEPGPDGTTLVVLQQRGGDSVAVVVERVRVDEPVQLTCHVPELSRPWSYRLVDVRAA